MTTLLIGYYGYMNAGDDAFVKVAQWANARFEVGGSLELTSDRPFESDLGTVRPLYASWIPERFAHQYRAWKFKRAAPGYGLNLFCGGSNFHSRNSLKLWKETFRETRGRIAAIGVSVGPFKEARAETECRELLRHFDLVAVRDQASFDRVRGMNPGINLHLAFDIGLLIDEASSPVLPPGGDPGGAQCIGVSLCNYERFVEGGDLNRERARRSFVIKMIQAILDEGLAQKVLLLSFNAHPKVGDVPFCRELLADLRRCGNRVELYAYDGDLNHLTAVVRGLKCLIGMRLHAVVFAFSLGVPFLMIPYHEKCYEFARMISLGEDRLISHDENCLAHLLDLIEEGMPPLDKTPYRDLALVNFSLLKGIC